MIVLILIYLTGVVACVYIDLPVTQPVIVQANILLYNLHSYQCQGPSSWFLNQH